MSTDSRNILNVLKFELAFLEQGGYGRSARTPWRPTSVFQDSPTCINFNTSERSHQCSECLLSDFVSQRASEEEVPCHHIPLNARGETIHGMERQRSRPETEDELEKWLHATIDRLEGERVSATVRKAV